MKVLLLNPNQDKDFVGKRARQPLELAYIASLLQDKHSVKILDASALNLTAKLTIQEINMYNPDILFVSTSPIDRWECPYINYERLTSITKKVDYITVAIGPHCTVTPEDVIKKLNVDFAIRGEPEYTSLELVERISNSEYRTTNKDFKSSIHNIQSIRGLSFRDNGKIIHNEDREWINDLDSLPFPAYNLLDMRLYHYNDTKVLPDPFSIVISSRGCPFKCVFCFKGMYGDKYRYRSPKNIADEVEMLVKKYNVSSIYFQDLEFTLNRNRVISICNEFKERKLKFNWAAAARVSDVDDEVLFHLSESGCKRLSFGVESGSNIVLEKSGKKITTEQIENALKLTKKYNIDFNSFWLFGLPGESSKTLQETLEFAIKNDMKYPMFPQTVTPYIDTDLYKMGKAKGIYNKTDWKGIRKGSSIIDTEFSYSILLKVKWFLLVSEKKYGKFYWFNFRWYKFVLSLLLKKL